MPNGPVESSAGPFLFFAAKKCRGILPQHHKAIISSTGLEDYDAEEFTGSRDVSLTVGSVGYIMVINNSIATPTALPEERGGYKRGGRTSCSRRHCCLPHQLHISRNIRSPSHAGLTVSYRKLMRPAALRGHLLPGARRWRATSGPPARPACACRTGARSARRRPRTAPARRPRRRR